MHPNADSSLVPQSSSADSAAPFSTPLGTPAQTAAGDDAARLVAIFETHGDELLGTACGLLGNRDDAVEAFQETFLKCWQRREQSAPIANLRGFVFTVLVNTCRDEKRRQRRKPALPLEVDVMDDARRGRPIPPPADSAVEQAELVDLLREAIDKLRPEDREVFVLRQNAGLSFAEIADLLDIPEGTAKTRMRKALAGLRSILDRCPTTRAMGISP